MDSVRDKEQTRIEPVPDLQKAAKDLKEFLAERGLDLVALTDLTYDARGVVIGVTPRIEIRRK